MAVVLAQGTILQAELQPKTKPNDTHNNKTENNNDQKKKKHRKIIPLLPELWGLKMCEHREDGQTLTTCMITAIIKCPEDINMTF